VEEGERRERKGKGGGERGKRKGRGREREREGVCTIGNRHPRAKSWLRHWVWALTKPTAARNDWICMPSVGHYVQPFWD